MSYTSYNVKSCIKTIESFKENISKSKNIIDSIDKLINSCYDLTFNIEEKNYSNYQYYGKKTDDNSAATFFSNLNKIKRRATQYYTELNKFEEEKTNSESNNDSEFSLIDNDKEDQLKEDYNDLIDDTKTYIDTFLRDLNYYPDYNYIPGLQAYRGSYSYIIKSIIPNIINKNNEHKLNTLLIESENEKDSYYKFFCPAQLLSETNMHEIYAFFHIKSGNTGILDYCNRYITGLINTCKISSGVFDTVFCNALNVTVDEIQSEYFTGTDKIKNEYSILIHALKYLRPGGLLVYSCHSFRYTKDICSLLAKYLSNVKIIKNEYIATVIGIRRKDKNPDQELYARLRQLWKSDFESDSYEFKYEILPANIEVKTFRGSYVDSDIANSLLKKHNTFNDVTLAQSNFETNKHPLLPFSLGQLGLVLTSGCLDGVIEEKDEHGNIIGCHAIKGTVQKITDRIQHNEIDIDHPTRRITEETISNKVSINVFKPNGELMTLA